MRKVGDVMKDMGFNKDSSVETQKAFIKHLIKAAYGVEVRDNDRVIPHQKPYVERAPEKDAPAQSNHAKRLSKNAPQQLSFDFDNKEDESA